jgi:hypothetical protein
MSEKERAAAALLAEVDEAVEQTIQHIERLLVEQAGETHEHIKRLLFMAEALRALRRVPSPYRGAGCVAPWEREHHLYTVGA